MSNKSKLGGMSKLSELSGIKTQSTVLETEKVATETEIKNKESPITKESEKLVAINIKIPKTQKDWLNHKAVAVRENNADPVPPGERVYPQHLIRVAIELLQTGDVDWSRVRNIEDLREQLNL
jgi:hypothetical protein